MLIPIKLISKSRKATMIFLSALAVISTGVAIIGFICWVGDQETLRKYGQPSFNTLPQDKLKDGLIVKGTIDLSLGAYVKKYEASYSTDASKTSTCFII